MPDMRSAVRLATGLALLFAFFAAPAHAQVSLNTIGVNYNQNFDSLAQVTSSTLPAGWALFEAGANANTTYAAGTGSSNTGDTWSYGVAGTNAVGDRAFGALASGNLQSTIGASFTNNTGATITGLDIAFAGEQWRRGGRTAPNPVTDTLDFAYSTNATALNNGTWTDVNTLDIVSPQTGTTAATLDGNAAANRVALMQTIGSLSIPNGATFWIRWVDTNIGGNDDGLAVDDFNITPQGAPPAPILNIGDFSALEGAAGTTIFTFNVTLTAPAPPGGVTFDIATTDNTATDADNDYEINSLTGQTIPATSTGPYQFQVTVNGDANPEPTETFFVNVSNIVGANAGDVQGTGTIQSDDVPPNLIIDDVSSLEGGAGTSTQQFTVSLSAPAGPLGVVFDIATAPNTATAPSDYVHQQIIGATIPAGQQSYTFDVTVNGDTLFEGNETYFVNVTNVTGAVITDGQGQGTIQNDDTQPSFSIADVAILEGNAGPQLLTFTVTMTGTAEGSATVNWQTADGTATVGTADYVADSGMLTFVSGDTSEQFSVTVNGDTTAEGDEHLVINLSGATIATIGDGIGFGIIKNDDPISVSAVDTPFTESMNALHPSSSPATPIGWTFVESGSAANLVYNFGTGTSGTGDTYSFATMLADPDKAFGGLQSGSLVPTIGGFYRNDTPTTITSLTIEYWGEQYRLGNAGRTDRLDFQYSLDATSLTTGTWTNVDALDFITPNTVTTGALDGNAAANRRRLLAQITSLSIAPGQTFWVRYSDFNASGADDGLAVDDFSLIANFTGAFLTINDVAMLEGNAGPTLFTFTVSLSAPAPPGGVTFDLVTADNTANAPMDYLPLSLIGAVIPAGQTSQQFAVTVNGDVDPEPSETFFVNITNVTNALVQDGQGVGTIVTDDVTITLIHDVQGPGASSPIVGSTVTVRGIVTGVKSNGFFVQEEDAEADADPATSEGVFVFTSSTPPAATVMGALVQVDGTVAEFIPSGDPMQPPLTELTTATVVQLSTGNPLPAPVTLTAAFPSPAGPFDQLERVEGMRVTVASLTTSSPTDGSFIETSGTGTSNGRFYGVVTGVPRPFREPGIQAPDTVPSGSIPPIPRWDFNPERLKVESGALGQPLLTVKSGDVLGPITGPLDYGFRAYVIYPDGTSAITVTPGTLPVTVAAPLVNEVTVASFNLQRFFDDIDDANGTPQFTGAAYDLRLDKASIAIRNHLNFPDIIGVQEVEKLGVLQDLAAQISADAVANAQPDPMYVGYLVEGNDVGGIDVGYLVKTAPVAAGVPRVAVSSVTQELDGTTWIDPDDNQPATLHDRPPLVLDATVNRSATLSYDIVVINNHLRSLLGIESEDPDGLTTEGDRVRRKRLAQAQDLANYIQGRQTADPAENLIVIGDFNAFEFNDGYVDVMNTITGTPPPDNETVVPGDGIDLVNPDLDNLVDTPPPAERYSYVHEGNAQNIDHALVNQALIASTSARRVEHPRIDADWPDTERNSNTTALRVSDHDPVVAYLTVTALAATDFTVDLQHASGYAVSGNQTTYTIVVTNNGPDAGPVTMNFPIPSPMTFVSLSPSVGCTTPAVGANGSINCTIASLAPATPQNFTLTVDIPGSVAANTVLNGTATVAGANDTNASNDSDSQSITVLHPFQYRATKTVSGSFLRGSAVTYTVTIFNDKPFAQGDNAGDELLDELPSGVTLVNATATTGTAVANVGTNTVTWNGAIASGGSVTITINATVNGTASGTVSNFATLYDDFDNNGSNERVSSSDDPGVVGFNDPTNFTVVVGTVTGTKTASGTFVSGTNVTYTIVLTNNMGLTQGDNFGQELTDTLMPGLSFVSANATSGTTGIIADTVTWNGSLAPNGGTVTITIVATITAASGTISNQGSVIYDADGDGLNDSNGGTDNPNTPAPGDATTFNVVPANSFSATKRDTAGTFLPGGNVTYQVVLTNGLPHTLADNPGNELVDVLPASLQLVSATATSGTAVATVGTNTVTWNGAIANGTSVTITINANIPANATAGTISNQGTASIDLDNNGTNETNRVTDDPDTGAANDPTSFTLNSPSMVTVTKTDSTTGLPGAAVTYTVVITNNLPHTLADNAGNELVDILSPSLELVGASATSGTAAANVGTKTVTWNGTIPAGGSVTITINATISGSASPGLISNQGTASVDLDNNGSNETNRPTDDPSTAAPDDPTSFIVSAPSQVTVTKTVATTALPGAAVTYTVVITNNTTHVLADNAGHELTDVVPSQLTLVSASATGGTAVATVGTNTVTWNGAIASGASVTITINATIPANAMPGAVSNQGSALVDVDNNGVNETTRPSDDPNTAAAGDPTVFNIVSPSQVTVTKSVGTTGVQGSSATYTVVITNNTGHALTDNPGAELTDVLPAQLDLVSATATSGTAVATVATNTVTWNGAIASGASVTITIEAAIPADAPTGTASNQGTASVDLDNNGANETSIVSDDPTTAAAADPTVFTITSTSQVTATKTVVTSGAPGSAVTYTIVITNGLPHTLGNNPGDELVDVLPPQLTLISATATSGTATSDPATRTVRWNGSIPSGGSVTITINAQLNLGASGAVVNQGTVNADVDNNGTNETSFSTDDPSQAGGSNGTAFEAHGEPHIPTLSWEMMLALAMMLAVAAALKMRS
jgi:uncharacterized protein